MNTDATTKTFIYPSGTLRKHCSRNYCADHPKQFPALVTAAGHLRGMWKAPSTDKDILTPNEKLKSLNTTNQTPN